MAKFRKLAWRFGRLSYDGPETNANAIGYVAVLPPVTLCRRQLNAPPLTGTRSKRGLLQPEESILDRRWAHSPTQNYMAKRVALQPTKGSR